MMYFALFLAFLRVGFFAFGGGLAALPLIEKEVVERTTWLTQREFLELVTLSELTPGPIAVNSATFTGFRVGGMLGAFVATSAFCLPSLILVAITSRFLVHFTDSSWVTHFLRGLRPVILALLISVALSFLQRGVDNVFSLLLLAGGVVLFSLRRVNPVLLLLLAGLLGILFYR